MAQSDNIIVSSLPDYVQTNRDVIIDDIVLRGPTIKRMAKQTGIKKSAYLNYLNVAPVFQNGAGCGFTPQGDIALTQKEINVGVIKINLDLCPESLRGKYAEYLVRTRAGEQPMPFEAEIVAEVKKFIQEALEKAIWQGDKTNGTGNLAIFDGILTILADENEVITLDPVEGANVAAEVYDAYANIPLEVLKDAVIYMGEDTFRSYVGELNSANLYHYDPKVDEGMTLVMPGTSTRIYGVPGLNGTSKIVAGAKNNFFYGTDLEGDQEVFDLWYSKDNQEFRLAIKFNAGVQVAFPDQIVVKSLDGGSEG